MDAKKEDKGKDTPELVPAPPVPARPSLLGQAAGVPWWLLRGLAKMNHETKAGLVVSASFLCLVGVVLYSKMREQEQPTVPADYQQIVKAGPDGELHAELPADPTPDAGLAGQGGHNLPTVSDLPLKEVPGQGIIRTSANVPAGKDPHSTDGLAGQKKKPTGQLADNGLGSSTSPGHPPKKKDPPTNGYDLELNLNNDDGGLGHPSAPDLGGDLGTHKTTPATVIPSHKNQTPAKTFHLDNGNGGTNGEHGLNGLPAKSASQAAPKASTSTAEQNHSAVDSQHGGASTLSRPKNDPGAVKPSQLNPGQSLGGSTWNGLNMANPLPPRTPVLPTNTPQAAPEASHAAAPFDLNSAHAMPTGKSSTQPEAGSLFGNSLGQSTTGVGAASSAGQGAKAPAKDPKNLFSTTLGGNDSAAGPKSKPVTPPAGLEGQHRLVMPAPDILMGHSGSGATPSTATGQSKPTDLVASPSPAKPIDPGVKLGQVVPTPTAVTNGATQIATPVRPPAALAPLPHPTPAPIQVAQATTPPPSSRPGDFGRPLPPVGATPTVSTAPVAVPMPRTPIVPITPRVASWDEEMYRFAPGDTFDQISQRYYGNTRYAQALLRFNRDRQPAADGLRLEPPAVAPGGVIYVPPAKVLEEKYPNVIPGEGRPAPTTGASLYQPASATPGTARQYKVGSGGGTFLQIAQQTLHDENRWADIYHLNPRYDPAMRIPAGAVLVLPADAQVPAANLPG